MSVLDAWRSEADHEFPWQSRRAGRRLASPFAETDFLGRKVPRRFGMPDYLLWICRIDPARVRRVPAAAIVEEGDFDALVACPCGAHPIATDELRRCADCERYYVWVGTGSVYVTYGSMTPPPLRSPALAESAAGTTEGAADVCGLNRPPVGPVGDPDPRSEGSPVGLAEGTPVGPSGSAGTLGHHIAGEVVSPPAEGSAPRSSARSIAT